MSEKIVASIDPGSAKCGLALVRREADGTISILERAIIPPDKVSKQITDWHQKFQFHLIVVGSGTKSKPMVHELREAMPSIGLLVVDEKDTTLQARERYWMHHKRRGWRKFVPSTLQTPPEPVDDFAAVILAERVLVAD